MGKLSNVNALGANLEPDRVYIVHQTALCLLQGVQLNTEKSQHELVWADRSEFTWPQVLDL